MYRAQSAAISVSSVEWMRIVGRLVALRSARDRARDPIERLAVRPLPALQAGDVLLHQFPFHQAATGHRPRRILLDIMAAVEEGPAGGPVALVLEERIGPWEPGLLQRLGDGREQVRLHAEAGRDLAIVEEQLLGEALPIGGASFELPARVFREAFKRTLHGRFHHRCGHARLLAVHGHQPHACEDDGLKDDSDLARAPCPAPNALHELVGKTIVFSLASITKPSARCITIEGCEGQLAPVIRDAVVEPPARVPRGQRRNDRCRAFEGHFVGVVLRPQGCQMRD